MKKRKGEKREGEWMKGEKEGRKVETNREIPALMSQR